MAIQTAVGFKCSQFETFEIPTRVRFKVDNTSALNRTDGQFSHYWLQDSCQVCQQSLVSFGDSKVLTMFL